MKSSETKSTSDKPKHKQIKERRHPKLFADLMQFMDKDIKNQSNGTGSFLCCGAQGKAKLPSNHHFQASFKHLTLEQKQQLYHKAQTYANEVFINEETKESINIDTKSEIRKILPNVCIEFHLILQMGWKSSKQIEARIEGFKMTSVNQDLLSIDLQNYLLRKSQKANANCYILEAIHESQPEVLRFSFYNKQQENQYHPTIEKIVNLGFKTTIKNMSIPGENISRIKYVSMPASERNSRGVLNQPSSCSISSNNEKSSPIFDEEFYINFIEFSKSDNIQRMIHEHNKNYKKKVNSLIGIESHRNSSILKSQSNFNKSQFVPFSKSFVVDELPEHTEKSRSRSLAHKQPSIVHRFLFPSIFSDVPIEEISNFSNYSIVYQNMKSDFLIYEQNTLKDRLKLIFNLDCELQTMEKIMINCEGFVKWNPLVVECNIQNVISSQNCLVFSQKFDSKSAKISLGEFLRHSFIYDGNFFVTDRLIQEKTHSHSLFEYQFIKIHRTTDRRVSILVELKVSNQKTKSKALQYLKNYQKLQEYIKRRNIILENEADVEADPILRTDWYVGENITKNEEQELQRQSLESDLFYETMCIDESDFVQDEEKESLDDSDFRTVDENEPKVQQPRKNSLSEKETHEKTTKVSDLHNENASSNLQNADKYSSPINAINFPSENERSKDDELLGLQSNIKAFQFDSKGMIVIPQNYIKQKHPTKPLKPLGHKIQPDYTHIVLKNDFEVDKSNGIRLVNKQKIEAQDSVFSFVIKTMKENLFSSKNFMNISLPVDIFKADSNTQRLSYSMSLGPKFLQNCPQDPLQRMKKAICFAMSNSILYLQIEKPFNPILGETYQGMIDGCPIYAQQISHHPPITSLIFYGRGYRVHVSIESKLNLHFNSANGVNHGYYKIEFDDGQIIRFQTCPGEVTGFVTGARTYRFIDRMFIFDQKNCFYSQVFFDNPNTGMFSKNKWTPDQFEGDIVKVSENFMTKFHSSKEKKHPKQADIQKKLSKVTGTWLTQMKFDGETYYDIVRDLPDKMVDYQYPLPSDARYREDLIYRAKNDVKKSQEYKEKLEVIQRNDRKLRQTYSKNNKKH